MAVEDLVHTAGGDHQAAPHRHPQLCGQAPRAQAWVTKGKADDALLNPGRQLVGHPWPTPFPRPQHLQPVALDQRFPAVVPGAVVTELPTGSSYPAFASLGEQQQTVAEEQIIISHGGTSSWA